MKKKLSYLLILCIMFLPTVVYGKSIFGEHTTICGFDYAPEKLPNFTSSLYDLVKILVPIILIVMGMIDFTKAVMASDENKMKDSQHRFITRLIAAIIIFLVMAVVEFAFKKIDDKSNYKYGFVNCMNCLLNGNSIACKRGTEDLRKQCSDYNKNQCILNKNDYYGNTCIWIEDNDNGSGNCVIKGSSCETMISKTQCDGYKINGISCEWINNSCRNVCGTINTTESCNKQSHCNWKGESSNSGSGGSCIDIKHGNACKTYNLKTCVGASSNTGYACKNFYGNCRLNCDVIKNKETCESESDCNWVIQELGSISVSDLKQQTSQKEVCTNKY